MANVYDVAEFILRNKGPISSMKLQKLVFYCQAWSLVWDDAPLFPEKIEAWANGPVVRELFEQHRGLFMVNSIPLGNPNNLLDYQMATIHAILDYYGDRSPQWLSDLTHMEDPWVQARRGTPENERGSTEISLESMAEYYSSLSPNE